MAKKAAKKAPKKSKRKEEGKLETARIRIMVPADIYDDILLGIYKKLYTHSSYKHIIDVFNDNKGAKLKTISYLLKKEKKRPEIKTLKHIADTLGLPYSI